MTNIQDLWQYIVVLLNANRSLWLQNRSEFVCPYSAYAAISVSAPKTKPWTLKLKQIIIH